MGVQYALTLLDPVMHPKFGGGRTQRKLLENPSINTCNMKVTDKVEMTERYEKNNNSPHKHTDKNHIGSIIGINCIHMPIIFSNIQNRGLVNFP